MPTIVAPISHDEWLRRLGAYSRLADALGRHVYCVAPDCVAHQPETLDRLRLYAEQVRQLAEKRAQIIVPVQKGALSMAAAWTASLEILGAGEWIAGVPMKKDATKLEELVAFVREARPERLHLLGLGPSSPAFRETLDAVRRASPGIEITCDSVLLRRLVGRTNGPGGGPRAVTAAQDEARALGMTASTDLKRYAAAKVASDLDREQQAEAQRAGWTDPELRDGDEATEAA